MGKLLCVVLHAGPELIISHGRSAYPKNTELLSDLAGDKQIVKRRNQLALGQIA